MSKAEKKARRAELQEIAKRENLNKKQSRQLARVGRCTVGGWCFLVIN